MNNILQDSTLHKDYLTTYIRDQLIRLSSILRHIEGSENYERLFLTESLKKLNNILKT